MIDPKLVLKYSDFTNMEDMSEFCKRNRVVFDFQLYDIPATMHRNVKTLADLGGYAVTVSDDPLNFDGILEAEKRGAEYGIKIIRGHP